MLGDHSTSGLEVAGVIPVASRLYNQSLGDSPLDIDPFESYLNGKPHVLLSIEQVPLVLNIMHQPNGLRYGHDREVNGQNLINLIPDQVNNISSEITDTLQNLRTGSINMTKTFNADDYEFATNNLSFIVDGSGFEQFNPDLIRQNLKKYIGVRVLHEIEVKVPSNIGTFQTGDEDIPHLDTSNPKLLARYNKKLSDIYPKIRLNILEKWQGNLSLVDVVYSPITGIDEIGLDHNLAVTVRQEWV